MQKRPSLITCLLLDGVGMLSGLVPFVGAVTDLVWAPVATLIYLYIFGFSRRAPGGIVLFIEELLPGTDFIPTFTITWLWLAVKEQWKPIL